MPCLRAYAQSGIQTHDPLITSREQEPLHHSATFNLFFIISSSSSDLAIWAPGLPGWICIEICQSFFINVWARPGLPGGRKFNLSTVTRRPHLSIAAGLYCLTTSPRFLPALCEKCSGFCYVHRVLFSYTQDRQLKVSSERLRNEDKALCQRVLLLSRSSNPGPLEWQLLLKPFWNISIDLRNIVYKWRGTNSRLIQGCQENMSGPENYLKLFNLYTQKNETYGLKINCQGLNSGLCLASL